MSATPGVAFVETYHTDIYPSIDPTKSPLSQPSKIVLITGAGRGLGQSVALRYAEAGVACIILCARTSSELESVEHEIQKINSAVRVRKFTLDVTNEEKVAAVAKIVTEEEGKLDVLINNSGVADSISSIADGNAEGYWNTFTVNLKGTYLMLKLFLPLLVATAKKTRGVDVINMSSIGSLVLIPGLSGYQTSKMAILRMGEFVDLEYGKLGVNCIGIHPGGVLTGMTRQAPKEWQAMLQDTPELCGGFVVWLTKGRKTWLAGRYVSANWDVEELELKKDEIVKGDKLKMRLVV